MTTKENSANNGVNVEALLGAREALTAAPEGAKFTWRADCEWKNGTHSHSSVEGFCGLGGEQKHRRVFTFDADQPEVFASKDNGATPVEYVLVGLASCLTAGVLSDECEPVSVHPDAPDFRPRRVDATRQERRCGSA